MKNTYYYRVQISWPSTRILYFKATCKKEIKNWTFNNGCGPDGVFIDNPHISPIDECYYIDVVGLDKQKFAF